MENQTQSKAMYLIQQVEELLSKPCITCSNCKAVYPNEYGMCPRCNMGNSLGLKIDFEI